MPSAFLRSQSTNTSLPVLPLRTSDDNLEMAGRHRLMPTFVAASVRVSRVLPGAWGAGGAGDLWGVSCAEPIAGHKLMANADNAQTGQRCRNRELAGTMSVIHPNKRVKQRCTNWPTPDCRF
jgi:hypothetical protein